jgi:Nucleotide modification associated domain 1
MNRVEQMKEIQQKGLELFERKNKDYGDAFAKFGLVGVLVRIEDKIQRAVSISNSGITLVDDEGLKDTLLDLHNYAAMALMLHEKS